MSTITEPVNVDPVGLVEVGRRLGVHPNTPPKWKARGDLPAERWRLNRVILWDFRRDIVPWAIETGLLRVDLNTPFDACPSCKAPESLGRLVVVHRRGGWHSQRSDDSEQSWSACGACGWTEWEAEQ